jgi:hypothetical protein
MPIMPVGKIFHHYSQQRKITEQQVRTNKQVPTLKQIINTPTIEVCLSRNTATTTPNQIFDHTDS